MGEIFHKQKRIKQAARQRNLARKKIKSLENRGVIIGRLNNGLLPKDIRFLDGQTIIKAKKLGRDEFVYGTVKELGLKLN